MADRATQRPGIPSRGTEQIAVGSPGLASPDVNRFVGAGGRGVSVGTDPTDEMLSRVIGNVANYGVKLAEVEFDNATQEAYLRGASAAGAGLTEQQLETSPLTADWAKAGYRDTVGRLALAKRQAQILTDLPKLAEQSPQEMQNYLNRSRAALEPSLQGMSRQARQNLFGELLTMDASATKAYGSERTKYIINQQTTALATGAQTQVAALDASKSDFGTYAMRTQEAYTWAHSNIVMNPNLPADVKQKLLGQYLSYAVSQNHMGLYDLARTQKVPDADGSQRTLLGMLPIDQQEKLGESFQKALKGTEAIRNQDYLQRQGIMQAALADPTQDLPDEGTFRTFIQEGLANGSLSASEVTSMSKQYSVARRKHQVTASSASAYLAGDFQTMANLGVTPQEGLKAVKEQWQVQQVPIPTRIQTLASAGIKGQLNAFQGMAEYAQPALTMLRAGQQPDEASAGALEQVMRLADSAEQNGRAGVHALLVSGMSEDDRDMYLNIQEGLRTGDLATAIASATDKQNTLKGMSSDVRRAMVNSTSLDKENRELVAAVSSRGLFSTLWGYAKFWSSDAQMRRAVEPFAAPLFGDPIVDQRAATAQRAYQEELAYVSAQNPTLSASSRDTKALAAVYSRTVQTDSGALIWPRGTNVQQFFGVPSNVGNERLGQALTEMTADLAGDSAAQRMYVSSQGKLMYERYNSDGDLQAAVEVDPKGVAAVIDRQREREGAQASREYGDGVTMTDKAGNASVQFNGVNTAAVDSALMLDFRQSLVRHEGIRNTPYADGGGGKVSGGVAVNSSNTYFPKDGRNRAWTQDEINSSFRDASNDAAITGTIVQSQTGLRGPDAFKLFSELAYQVGPGFRSRPGYTDLMGALMARDRAAAIEAFRKTSAYKASGQTRRDDYEKLITNLTE